MEEKVIIKKIIESSTYLSLATTDGEKPWVNAVFFASDKKYNMYFVSYNDSLHVKNILNNPRVAVVLFDSHIVPGKERAQGIQISGLCKRLTESELPIAIEIVYVKRFPDSKDRATKDLSIQRFTRQESEGRIEHIYKITPEHFYILDTKVGKDTRKEVYL